MDNRANLLEVALKLFATHGYDAVGVQTIVKEAGVTKPTLYHYFSSKQGLFEIMVREKSEDWLEGVRTASAYNGDITLSITKVVRAYLNFAERQPDFYRMILAMWFAPPSSEYAPTVRALLYEHTAMLETMFESAVNDHGNMRGRQRLYALSLKGVIDTYIGIALQGYTLHFSEDMIYRIVHQFMHGIFS